MSPTSGPAKPEGTKSPCMISGKSLISNMNCYFSREFSLEENIFISDR